jgi:hypothetical protein
MKKLGSAVVLSVAALACSGNPRNGDGGIDAGPTACNMVTQAPCPAGQRCAWVVVSADGGTMGYAWCMADGTVSAGNPCSVGAPGPTTGFDNCVHGTSCFLGVDGGYTCQVVCSLSPDSCPTLSHCAAYANFLNNPGTAPQFGVCEESCNPITQYLGTAPACGSPNPAAPSMGCYGAPNGNFSCARNLYPNNTEGTCAGSAGPGQPFLNGCATGFVPLLLTPACSNDATCTAYCQPGPTSSSSIANAAGLAGSAYTCPARGAAGTNECRYWQFFENQMAPGFPDSYSNTIGACLDYTQFHYNPDGGGCPAAGCVPFPSCTTLSSTAHGFSTTLTDTQFWGCEPHP